MRGDVTYTACVQPLNRFKQALLQSRSILGAIKEPKFIMSCEDCAPAEVACTLLFRRLSVENWEDGALKAAEVEQLARDAIALLRKYVESFLTSRTPFLLWHAVFDWSESGEHSDAIAMLTEANNLALDCHLQRESAFANHYLARTSSRRHDATTTVLEHAKLAYAFFCSCQSAGEALQAAQIANLGSDEIAQSRVIVPTTATKKGLPLANAAEMVPGLEADLVTQSRFDDSLSSMSNCCENLRP
jgi:hypothetical protein